MSHHYSGPHFAFPRGDARLDYTDLFAFPKPDDASKSILILDVHPSFDVIKSGPTTAEPFAPDALYEIKIDTDGDAVADIAYQIRFPLSKAVARPRPCAVWKERRPPRQARAGRSLSKGRRSRWAGRRR